MIDHLVFASNDLPTASARIADCAGSRPRRPVAATSGEGTYNELLSLGGATYLEVIGPDPAQPAPDGPRPFGIDGLTGRLSSRGACVRQRPLAEIVDRGAGRRHRARRRRRDVATSSRRCVAGVGTDLSTARRAIRSRPAVHDRLGPTSAHPSDTLPAAVRLVGLDVYTSDAGSCYGSRSTSSVSRRMSMCISGHDGDGRTLRARIAHAATARSRCQADHQLRR